MVLGAGLKKGWLGLGEVEEVAGWSGVAEVEEVAGWSGVAV